MISYFHKKVWLGFITSIAIILWLAVASYVNNKKSADSREWVSHTNRVLYHSEQILSLVVDIESGQRGYALTGMEEFLEPTHRAARIVGSHVKSLRELTSDNRSQQDRIDEIERLLDKKIGFSQRAIETRKNEGLEKTIALNSSLEGKHLMDTIRSLIEGLQEEEHLLLKERTTQTDKRVAEFHASFGGMLFATIIILILVFYMIYSNLKARTDAERSLREAHEKILDIYDNAPCGYHSLDANGIIIEMNNTWLQWLKLKKEDVIGKVKFVDLLTPASIEVFRENFPKFKEQGFVRDLLFDMVRSDGTTLSVLLNSVAIVDANNNYVKSRSTVIDYTEQKRAREKIEQLNGELESFSYSVSHDLRAPLRSIDGYTQILLEDYADKLDSEGKRILNVVVNNARRMATLIDDLLDFSRISRKDVALQSVSTENMLASVISELKSLEVGRNIETIVHALDNCEADPNLLRQVWINLISNAFKYTRKRPAAKVEISSYKNPSEVVFKIQDNGTGFDMQYAHKLFGVFQRLHRQQEFEGTGVGLAIVHRIISRHGGRVWAEGGVDKGATFYFSLPRN
jgi:PAS domain S-box-containing protein